jgi:hypothetical protein
MIARAVVWDCDWACVLRWGEAWDRLRTGLLGSGHRRTRPRRAAVMIVFVQV